jgi:hypothetical protein
MQQASKGAQNNNQTLQNSAQNNLDFQTQQRNAQFGANGSLTPLMNPSSLNVTNPQGAYATQYKNEANQVNQGANQAVATTNRQMANQGGGVQPSGYGAAQTMSAYQNAANEKANLFSQNAMASQNQNLNNFWNAQNAYGQQGAQAGQQANQALGTANGTDTSLYGQASNQKKSIWSTLGGVAAGGVGMI